MTPDHFDVFGTDDHDDDGSTSDYWDAYLAAAEDAAMDGGEWFPIVTDDDSELPFLLTDDELAALDSDVDTIPADQWWDAIADDSIVGPF